MNLNRLARDQALRATDRIRDARRVAGEGRWADAVRLSQEGVELALKGLLRSVAVEVPKRHDVGPVLEEVADRLPPAIRRSLPQLVELSHALAGMRALATYGDEIGGRTPDELFGDPGSAASLLSRAAQVTELVADTLGVSARPGRKPRRAR